MPVSEDKVRTMLTLRKDVKKELEQIAKEQNRSLNNLIETILNEYLER